MPAVSRGISAISRASTTCTPCPRDSLFSNSAGSLDGSGVVVLCNACPSTRGMVQELVDAGILAGSLQSFPEGEYFLDSSALCRPGMRVNTVADFMQPREICAAGQFGLVQEEDRDTECTPCPVGTYSDMPGAHSCEELQTCSGQLRDVSTFRPSGQTEPSLCADDFDLERVAVGEYPRMNTTDAHLDFAYHAHRYVAIYDYVPCVPPSPNMLCGSPSNCVHNFLAAWRSGSVAPQSMSSAPATAYTCVYTCRAGFELRPLQQACLPCAQGKYKALSGTQDVCVLCPAGKINQLSTGAIACQDCSNGKYSSDTTTCRDLCDVSRRYTSNHHCFRDTPWYIVTPSNNREINIASCKIDSALVLGQWLLTMAGVGQFIQWSQKGENMCLVMQKLPARDCTPQSAINNAVSVAQDSCIPVCGANFYRTYAPTRQEYTCVPCDFNSARLKVLNCVGATYLAKACHFSENTRCMPCAALAFQILDANSISAEAYTETDRCKFKCIDPVRIAGVWWYFTSQTQTRRHFNLDASTPVGCIRSNVSLVHLMSLV